MQGQFIWYELLTTDTKAASDFYSKVAGWVGADSGMPGIDYTLFNVPGFEMGLAGMMALTDEMCEQNVPPHWLGYVYFADVDAKTDEFVKKGSTTLMPPHDIPGIGRFSVMRDPQGAAICLMKTIMPEGPMPPCPEPGSPGTFGWHELYAADGAEAMAFYAEMFGWQELSTHDIGPMGTYHLFGVDGEQIGGMMTRPPQMPQPAWAFYINVDAIDDAVERVKTGGGQVLTGPMEVPGGDMIAQCFDPQGAFFALVEHKS
ncbi:VOC family protein [Martelella radicis]|uniref:VOC domain-containing protein n=1 Tax=Martelella radicis TaxID=1397476 RepID=A0A7W6PDF2_9HYPH|nr:VOC family protein [Martelella radicis]MBB4124392.1 hypothetical protein [Martelella radicis]